MTDRPTLDEAFAAAAQGLDIDPESIKTDEVGDVSADTAQSDEDHDPVDEDEDVEAPEALEAEEGEEAVGDDSEGEVEGTAIPDTYFGVDLSELPQEAKQQVFDSLRNKDRYSNKLSQEKSGLEKEVAELREFIESRIGGGEDEGPDLDEDGNPQFEMPADDDILKFITEEYKLDPDDPFYEIQVKAALPGVKAAISADVRNQQLQYQIQLAEFERSYHATLDQLEAQQGQLPLPRGEFLEWAAQNDLGDPKVAYETFVTHAKDIIQSETSEARKKVDATKAEAKRALKKKVATGSRKSAAGVKESPNERPSFDDAIAQAAKDTGFDLS